MEELGSWNTKLVFPELEQYTIYFQIIMGILFYGFNEHLGKSYEIENYCCPFCDHYNSTELFISSNYFHFFFVPYIPIGKTGSALCSQCRRVIPEGKFSPGLIAEFAKHAKEYHHPLKIYSGFILFPGTIILAALFYLLFSLFSSI